MLMCTTCLSTCVKVLKMHMWGMEEIVMMIMWQTRLNRVEEEFAAWAVGGEVSFSQLH